MGLQTLVQFRTRLQTQLGNRGLEDADLDYWINTAVQDLAGRMQFDTLVGEFAATAAIGDKVLTLVTPATNAEISGLIELSNDTEQILVTKIGKARYLSLDPTERGQTQFWYRRGKEFVIWPSPEVATTFSGSFLATIDALVDDADVTEYHQRWDRAVQLLAPYHALTDLEEPNRAAGFLQMSEQFIQRRIEQDDIEGEATGMPVQPIESFEQLHRQREVSRTFLGSRE